jgi:threonine/homoserine/homoserine lactone efflux protein
MLLFQITYLFTGITTGLVLSIMAGPILFSILQTSIIRGWRAGFSIAVGQWFSDICFILLIAWGLISFAGQADEALFKLYVGVIGGAMLIFFGLNSLFSKPPSMENIKVIDAVSLGGYFAKGFAINTFNPFTLIFWIWTTATIILKNKLTVTDSSLFYVGVLLTIASLDTLKIYLARQIREYMLPIHLVWLRRISGIALIVFGIILVIRVI